MLKMPKTKTLHPATFLTDTVWISRPPSSMEQEYSLVFTTKGLMPSYELYAHEVRDDSLKGRCKKTAEAGFLYLGMKRRAG
jgi:hypothetical protein